MTNLTRSSGAVLKTYTAAFRGAQDSGELFNGVGNEAGPERMSINSALYVRAMLNPFLAMGITAMILTLLTRMALLSLADPSFVFPVTNDGNL